MPQPDPAIGEAAKDLLEELLYSPKFTDFIRITVRDVEKRRLFRKNIPMGSYEIVVRRIA